MFELRACDRLRLTVLGCALLAVTQTAAAQSFPSRPLTLVVPFAAGGPSDVAGRIVAQGLSEKLGQQVVVENPAGAGGTLGSLRVANAPPDGYQFVIGNSGTHAWSQALYKKPPYHTVTDFAALGLIVEAPRAIITPKNFPANTLPEFIAYVKANQHTVKRDRERGRYRRRARRLGECNSHGKPIQHRRSHTRTCSRFDQRSGPAWRVAVDLTASN